MNQNPYESPAADSQPPGPPASGKIWVQIDRRWIHRVHSPLYLVIGSLTGISVSFAPLGLFYLGGTDLPDAYRWTLAGICFALIFFVPAWYMWLASAVVKDLRENRTERLKQLESDFWHD